MIYGIYGEGGGGASRVVSTGETRIFSPFSFPIHSLSLYPLQTDRSESGGLVFSRERREIHFFPSLLPLLNVSKKMGEREEEGESKGNERNIYKGGNRYGWLEIRTKSCCYCTGGGSRRDKNTRSGWVGNCASVVTALGANERSDRAKRKTCC